MEIKISEANLEIVKNGPCRVIGKIELKHENGEVEEKERVSLCRCGESFKMPFCDGNHKKIGFEG